MNSSTHDPGNMTQAIIRIRDFPGFCLRPFAAADAQRLAKLAGVTSVVRYTLGIPLPYSVEAAAEWIAGLEARVGEGIELIYALSLRGHLVGSIGLIFEPEHQRAEIGYWLGEPYRGRGLTRAAVQAVCDHVVMINAGKLVVSGATNSLLERTGLVTIDVGRHTEELVAGLARAGVAAVAVDDVVEATVGDDAQMDLVRDVVAEMGLPLFRLSTRLRSLDEAFVRRSEELA